MRTLFILLFIANVAVTLISLAVLPHRVAIHFGIDGLPNGWAPNYVNAILMSSVHLLILFSIYFSPSLAFLLPAKWINLPNKEYWLMPVNRSRALEMLRGLLWRFGIAIFLFFLVIGLLAIQANMAKPVRLNEAIFLPAFGAFVVYVVYWTIVFYRAFRLNGEGEH